MDESMENIALKSEIQIKDEEVSGQGTDRYIPFPIFFVY
jgi:hypothetical protein